MSSENTLPGRLGRFVVGATTVTRTKQWQITRTLASKSEWGDSDGGGWTNRAPGRNDATFTAEGVFDISDEVFDLFQPGDIAIATLWLNNTTLYWDFPRAMNDNFQLTVNVDTEDVIGWTSSWGADGRVYYPGEAGAAVRAAP